MAKQNGDIMTAMAQLQEQFQLQMSYLNKKGHLSDRFYKDAKIMLANMPEYVIPDAVNDLVKVLSSYATEVKDQYNQAADDVKRTIEDNVGKALEAYISNANKAVQTAKESGDSSINQFRLALDTANRSADNILKLAQANKTEILDEINKGTLSLQEQANKIDKAVSETVPELTKYYETTAKGILDQYREGSTTMFNTYQQLARNDMPGYDLYRQRLEAGTAGDVEKLKELTAGRPGALEAIAKLMGERNVNLQDLAVQNAAYKTQAEKDLATAAVERAKLMGEGYTSAANIEGLGKERLLGYQTGAAKDIADIESNIMDTRLSGINEANAGLLNAEQVAAALSISAQQDLGQQISNVGQNLSKTQLAAGQMTGNAYMDAMNARTNAIQTSAQLKGQGIQQAAGYETSAKGLEAQYADTAWQYNKLMPWEQKYQYSISRAAGTDPTQYMMQLYGDQAGVALAQLQGEYDKQAANKAMWGNIIGSILGAGSRTAAAAIGG